MQRVQSTRRGMNRSVNRAPGRRAALMAAAVLALGSGALAQTTLYFDLNGATAGFNNTSGTSQLSSTGTWDTSTTSDWNTSSTGTGAPGTWLQPGQTAGVNDYNIATFSGTNILTANLVGTVDVGGIVFTNSFTNVINGSGTLNFGSNNVNINTTYTGSTSDNIEVPITGSGTFTFNYAGTGTQGNVLNLTGSMTGFTGTLVIAPDTNASAGPSNYTQLSLNSDLGSGATIQLDNFAALVSSGPTKNTITGVSDPIIYTLHAPITLNATNVATGQEWISGNNGSAGSGIYGETSGTFSAGSQVITTYAGVISGNNGATGALNLGYGVNGGRGTVILDAQETYTGNTCIVLANAESGTNSNAGNGLVQLGVDNALPATTILYFGPNPANTTTSGNGIAPLDLNGHNMTIAGLGTSPRATSGSQTVFGAGNIFDTSPNGTTPNPVTITINGSATTSYQGDIGDTNIAATNPFNDQSPYVTAAGGFQIQANNTVSLSLNGTGTMTLAPVAALVNGDEYTGTTTVNSGTTLIFGRSSTYSAPYVGTNNTITGGGTVTVNSGGTLASAKTTFGTTPTYIGGAAGNIVLNSGSSFLPGGNGTTGVFSTSSMTFDSGASMTFDLISTQNYDQIVVNNALTLDSSGPNHTINITAPSSPNIPLTSGTYTLISTGFGINYDGTNGFVLGSTPTATGDKFTLVNTGYSLQLQVIAPLLQYDPTGQGPTSGNGTINEGPGTFTSSTTFYDFGANPPADVAYGNAPSSETVEFGNDATQSGGQVVLGQNITIANLLQFGPIAQGGNYDITGTNSLMLDGGIYVSNSAATLSGTTYTTPSAEIDAPVVLGASQTWNIDSANQLIVNGAVTENDGTPSYTLTKSGAGELDLNGAGGSFAALDITAGSVVLGATNALGNAAIAINGGALEFSVTGTFTNAISAGSSGFAIGVNSGATATITPGITSTGPMALVDNGTLVLSGNVSATSLTNETLGTTTFNGSANFGTGTITNTTTGGRIYFNGNTTAGSVTVTAGTTLLAQGATDSFTNGLNITAGTLVVGSASDVGVSTTNTTGNNINFTPVTSAGGTLNLGGTTAAPNGVTVLPNNISIGSSADTQYGSTITTIPFGGGTSTPVTLSGIISGNGNLTLQGTDYTLAGANTFGPSNGGGGALGLGNTGTNAGQPMTIHASNATSFGSGAIVINAGVTLDIQTNVTANAIRGNALMTKIGSGTLILNGKTALGPGGNQLGYIIQTGAIQLDSISGLGGSNTTVIASATAPSQGTITIDPTASLLIDTNGNDYTGTITQAGGTIARINDASNAGDYNLTTYFTDTSASPAADTHNAVLNVTASSLIDNQDQAVAGATHNLSVQMPITVSSGATLNLEADNTAGNYEQAAVVLQGTSNNTQYPYNNLTLQAGATVAATGTGDVDLGGVATGEPIVAMGTPGSDALVQLGSHTFLNDTGAATQNQGTNSMTRLIVDGSGSAGLRIEAPMDATYTVPNAGGAPSLQTYEGTTGLTGINTTGTAAAGTTPTGYNTIANGFTVLSPARAAALSNTYTLANGTTITPAGTLTLAATDASGATGLINAGPAVPSAVSLALDNAASSGGTLVYQINPGANSATFANFAGLTVQRTYANAGVTAQLLGNTKVPALSITGGAKVDITNQALVIDPSSYNSSLEATIEGYLKSAYDKGAWDGPGIGTSSMTVTNGMSIGYAGNSELATPYSSSNPFGGSSGQAVDGNAVLVRYTYLGDLNLDGIVNGNDLSTLMANVGNTSADWAQGDLNYDGVVNADDFSLFQLGAAEYALHGQVTSAVPEPGITAMLILGAMPFAARRRRR